MMSVRPADAAGITLVQTPPAYSGTINLSGMIDGQTQTLQADFTVQTFSGTQLVIAFDLLNTTPVATPGGNRMIAFGFDILPDVNRSITGVEVSNSGWTAFADGGTGNNDGINITNGTRLDICSIGIAGANNCSGGGNGGLDEGQGASLTLTIAGTFGSPLSLDNFTARFQETGTNSGGSGIITTFTITTDDPGTGSENVVPEPASLALFGLGLAGLGLASRRRQRRGVVQA